MLSILEILSQNFQKILGKNLTGLYLHGSLCLGGFQWDSSDIDLLAVVNEKPDGKTKTALIKMLLSYRDLYPAKGIEFSLMLFKDCQNFSYPPPYLLHLSPIHYEKALADPNAFAKSMHSKDPDLACHLTIIAAKGICLYGKSIAEVFTPVPRVDYIKSIVADLSDAKKNIMTNPVYYLLNFARTEAYLIDNQLLSKEDGGRWVINNKRPYAALMEHALNQLHGKEVIFDPYELQACLTYYLNLFENIF